MATNVSASDTDELVEERLISGLLTGSLLQHKELLDTLDEVDGRFLKERTLLHVGVRLGKVDWVEELLARGADLELMDGSQVNALSSAEEMVRRFPEDSNRSEVLKLMTLVHRRDQVMKHRLSSSSSRSTDHTTPVARPNRDIESLKSTMDDLRQEIKYLVGQLRSSLEELKAQVCGRDVLLHCLEEAVTSTVEDLTLIKSDLGGKTIVGLLPSDRETVLSPLPSDPAKDRQKCINAMLRRTEIVYGDGVEIMRGYYERLYDEDDCTVCILKHLSGDDRVKVLVDCESKDIGRMKDKVVHLDGDEWDVSGWPSFCDLDTKTVYVGLKNFNDDGSFKGSVFIRVLSQLSLKLAFCNSGLPYKPCDIEREDEWMRALQEVELENIKRGGMLHEETKYALHCGTQLAKLRVLATAVPDIIILEGSTAGRVILHEQAPLLLSLYTNQVVPTILAKAKQ